MKSDIPNNNLQNKYTKIINVYMIHIKYGTYIYNFNDLGSYIVLPRVLIKRHSK